MMREKDEEEMKGADGGSEGSFAALRALSYKALRFGLCQICYFKNVKSLMVRSQGNM